VPAGLLDADRLPPVGEHEFGAGLGAPPHRRRHGGGEVVVDRAHLGSDQRVDQRALALLEIADDHEAAAGVTERGTGGLDARSEIRPPDRRTRVRRQVEQRDRLGQFSMRHFS
jgi:hypothetical protein